MASPTSTPSTTSSGSMFEVYKPGQGTYTRMGTAATGGLLVLLFARFVADQLTVFETMRANEVARYAIATGVLLALAAALWIALNRSRNAQFLIETDNELKKVNWTSRKDLVVSTRVVISFMFLTAIFLFVVDMIFGFAFYLIGVLKTNPFQFFL